MCTSLEQIGGWGPEPVTSFATNVRRSPAWRSKPAGRIARSEMRQQRVTRAGLLSAMAADSTHPIAQRNDDLMLNFRRLNEQSMLVLPNCWDAGSARVIEAAGASAIATSSGAVAWSLGRSDGEIISRNEAVLAVRRITSAVQVPVSADIETGYGLHCDDVAATVRAVLDAGAAGINIEDNLGSGGLREVATQAERLHVVRDVGGAGLFINARTDCYLGHVEPRRRLDETINRAFAYANAGADGIFVPGLIDAADIATIANEVPIPLNVMAGPGTLHVSQLASLGVRRVSVGTALAEAALATVRTAASELLESGTYTAMSLRIDYTTLNTLFDSAQPQRT